MNLAALKRIVHPDSTVLDVGAHIGYLTCYFSHLVDRDGEVHAFEPSRALADVLRCNAEQTGRANIKVNQLAVGSRSGWADLWLPKSKFGRQSFCRENVPEPVSFERVQVTSLDEYAGRVLPDGTIDLIKIDVEGAELEVLAGAEQTLRRTRNVWLELWPEGIARFGGDPYFAFSTLRDAGFTVTQWDIATGEHRVATSTEAIKWAFEQMPPQSQRPGLLPIFYLHAWRQDH